MIQKRNFWTRCNSHRMQCNYVFQIWGVPPKRIWLSPWECLAVGENGRDLSWCYLEGGMTTPDILWESFWSNFWMSHPKITFLLAFWVLEARSISFFLLLLSSFVPSSMSTCTRLPAEYFLRWCFSCVFFPCLDEQKKIMIMICCIILAIILASTIGSIFAWKRWAICGDGQAAFHLLETFASWGHSRCLNLGGIRC